MLCTGLIKQCVMARCSVIASPYVYTVTLAANRVPSYVDTLFTTENVTIIIMYYEFGYTYHNITLKFKCHKIP